jgi:hypothetical protein
MAQRPSKRIGNGLSFPGWISSRLCGGARRGATITKPGCGLLGRLLSAEREPRVLA